MIIHRIRPVKMPEKGTPQSAGFDFFIPSSWPITTQGGHQISLDTIFLGPSKSILIPSGIKAIIPEGYCLVFFNKSGVANKLGLQVGACVVDSDYRGEIHLHVTNTGREGVELKTGMKLVQGLVLPVPEIGITEIEWEEWERSTELKTDRGEGGFGSTGTY